MTWRRFWVDFNALGAIGGDPRTIVASARDGEAEGAAVGDLCILGDCDGNLCEATILELKPSPHSAGAILITCDVDMTTWVDGDTAAAVALAWVRHPNRNVPAWPGARVGDSS